MATFGASKEQRFKSSQYQSTPPGPGAYSVDTADISDVAARVTFGHTARFVEKAVEVDGEVTDGSSKETLTAAARLERRKSYGMMHTRVRRRSLKTSSTNRENRQQQSKEETTSRLHMTEVQIKKAQLREAMKENEALQHAVKSAEAGAEARADAYELALSEHRATAESLEVERVKTAELAVTLAAQGATLAATEEQLKVAHQEESHFAEHCAELTLQLKSERAGAATRQIETQLTESQTATNNVVTAIEHIREQLHLEA